MKTITLNDMLNHAEDVIRDSQEEPIVVMDQNLQVSVVISYGEYERLASLSGPNSEAKNEDVNEIRFRPDRYKKKVLTGQELLNSGLIGLWKDRTDITDRVEYARYLRKQAEKRGRVDGWT